MRTVECRGPMWESNKQFVLSGRFSQYQVQMWSYFQLSIYWQYQHNKQFVIYNFTSLLFNFSNNNISYNKTELAHETLNIYFTELLDAKIDDILKNSCTLNLQRLTLSWNWYLNVLHLKLNDFHINKQLVLKITCWHINIPDLQLASHLL